MVLYNSGVTHLQFPISKESRSIKVSVSCESDPPSHQSTIVYLQPLHESAQLQPAGPSHPTPHLQEAAVHMHLHALHSHPSPHSQLSLQPSVTLQLPAVLQTSLQLAPFPDIMKFCSWLNPEIKYTFLRGSGSVESREM